MTVDLLNKVKCHANRDQQARASIEAGDHVVDAKRLRDDRGHNRDQRKESCTDVGNSLQNLLEIVLCSSTWAIPRNKRSAVLQIVRNLLRIESDCRLEVAEEVNEDYVHQVVDEAATRFEGTC